MIDINPLIIFIASGVSAGFGVLCGWLIFGNASMRKSAIIERLRSRLIKSEDKIKLNTVLAENNNELRTWLHSVLRINVSSAPNTVVIDLISKQQKIMGVLTKHPSQSLIEHDTALLLNILKVEPKDHDCSLRRRVERCISDLATLEAIRGKEQ